MIIPNPTPSTDMNSLACCLESLPMHNPVLVSAVTTPRLTFLPKFPFSVHSVFEFHLPSPPPRGCNDWDKLQGRWGVASSLGVPLKPFQESVGHTGKVLGYMTEGRGDTHLYPQPSPEVPNHMPLRFYTVLPPPSSLSQTHAHMCTHTHKHMYTQDDQGNHWFDLIAKS